MINEDLYDTRSAVVGLYRLFTNFLKFPGESPRLGGSIGGMVGVSLGSPDLPPHILHFTPIKTIRDHQPGGGGGGGGELYLKLGKNI